MADPYLTCEFDHDGKLIGLQKEGEAIDLNAAELPLKNDGYNFNTMQLDGMSVMVLLGKPGKGKGNKSVCCIWHMGRLICFC